MEHCDALNDFTVVIGGDATHVAVDHGKDGDGFLGDIDSGEDCGRFTDSGQPFGQQVGW